MSACPQCGGFNSRVNETRRLRNGWVRRHRRCLEDECLHRWYTYEIPSVQVETPDTEDLRHASLGDDGC